MPHLAGPRSVHSLIRLPCACAASHSDAAGGAPFIMSRKNQVPPATPRAFAAPALPPPVYSPERPRGICNILSRGQTPPPVRGARLYWHAQHWQHQRFGGNHAVVRCAACCARTSPDDNRPSLGTFGRRPNSRSGCVSRNHSTWCGDIQGRLQRFRRYEPHGSPGSRFWTPPRWRVTAPDYW